MTGPRENMWATIYTDASFDYRTKTGAGAWWIKCDVGTVKGTRKFISLEDPNEAEMLAIVLAAQFAVDEFGGQLKGVSFHTDSMAAINNLKFSGKPNPKYKHLFSLLEEALGTRWRKFQHVKAHTGQKDARAWLNRWCDKTAGETLRSGR